MIVGAGLAGLLAAHAFPTHPIVEATPEPTEIHKALLRFRTPKVGELVGIEFKAVMVDKGIYYNGAFAAPNIALSNLYARKVIGNLAARSIRHTESVKRYIAPPDLYPRLLEAVKHRISWGMPADFTQGKIPIINTAPLPTVLKELEYDIDVTFQRSPIWVKRFHIPGADVYQTVYYPTEAHTMYRASITGNTLIAEFMNCPSGRWEEDLEQSFALGSYRELDNAKQKFGKIADIDGDVRRALIGDLTERWGIYSLGRYGTWRNILLDDVVDDISVIRKMLTMSAYERKLRRTENG
jgi:hypothetical protein